MKLYRLLERMEFSVLSGSADVTISTIESNSTKVKENSVFVALKGNKEDGHDFVGEAVKRGAIAIVAERQVYVPDNITVILVRDTRVALSYIAAAYYNYPSERIRTIAVTGTIGKTTLCQMLAKLLTMGGVKTFVMEAGCDYFEFHEKLDYIVNLGMDAVVIEASSMDMKRQLFAGITFDYAVLTNLYRKHIGENEHCSYKEYIACKSQLFKQSKIGIVNADCEKLTEVLKDHNCRVETYGHKNTNLLYAYQPVLMKRAGYTGTLVHVGGAICTSLELFMPGLFNIYNALACMLVARHFDISRERMKECFANEWLLSSRCESVATL